MILADTQIWISHFRRFDDTFHALAAHGSILMHPLVIGELAVGNLQDREATLHGFFEMAQAIVAHDKEVLDLIDDQQLYGIGIGYVDAHLLASTRLTPHARLWTRDRRLRAVAERMDVAAAAD